MLCTAVGAEPKETKASHCYGEVKVADAFGAEEAGVV